MVVHRAEEGGVLGKINSRRSQCRTERETCRTGFPVSYSLFRLAIPTLPIVSHRLGRFILTEGVLLSLLVSPFP